MAKLCLKCGKALNSSDYCVSCEIEYDIYKKLENTSDILYNRALERVNLRDLSNAIELLNKSLKLNKYNIQARNLLGLVYYEIGETIQAIKQWVISKNISSHDNLADYYLDIIQNNQANLEKINNAIAKYNASLKHIQQNSIDLAIIQLRKVTSNHSNFIDALLLLGLCYYKEGNVNKAKKTFNRVLQIDRSNFLARKYLDALLQNNENSEESEETEVKDYSYKGPFNYTPSTSYFQQIIFIVIGVVIGLVVGLFLIAPTKINEVEALNNELNKDIIEVQNSLNRMTEDYKSEKQNREQLEQDTVRLEKKLDEEKDIAMEMEKILLAQQLYNTGDLLGSADQIYLLNDGLIDTHPIYSFTLEFRQDLAKELYEIGKKAYFIRNEENYKKAVQYFEISRKLASDGEYAHNALYLMGIAKYKLGNNEEALADFKYYVDNYPEGDNHTDAAWYITQIE